MFVIAVISLLCSAFFSGIEIAFVSANKLQLELDKNSKNFSSKFISYFSKSDSDFITTMLVGNNISLVIYGVFMTKILYPLLIIYSQSDFVLLLLQTIITTLIVLLVAEFLPKVIFKIYPNFALNFLCIPIWIFFILLRPVTILFLKISNWILKYIFNQKDQKTQPTFSKTDLDDYLSNIKNNDLSEDNRIEVEMLQNADHIYIEALKSEGLYDSIWQAGVILIALLIAKLLSPPFCRFLERLSEDFRDDSKLRIVCTTFMSVITPTIWVLLLWAAVEVADTAYWSNKLISIVLLFLIKILI